MTPIVRTLVYAGVAGALVLAAYFSNPGSPRITSEQAKDELLFGDYDPEKITKLEVVRFDDAKTAVNQFSVAKTADGWAIPSHGSYPADAKEQFVNAAKALSGLAVVSTVTENANEAEREQYGVLEPTIENIIKGAEAIGTRVVLSQGKDDVVKLIIGKPVGDKPELRYASVPGQDRIVTLKIDPAPLSTKFGEWIETDLLKIASVFDVTKLSLHDYTVDVRRSQLEERMRMDFNRDQKEAKWAAARLEKFDAKERKWQPVPPGTEEELSQQAIDDVRDALNQLKIVDVERKPEKVRQTLLAGEIFEDQETIESLNDKGFHALAMPGPSGRREPVIKSTNGEMVVATNDGVKYTLRFGESKGVGANSGEKGKQPAKEEKKPDAADDDKTADKDAVVGLHRYLWVTAEFDPSLIAKPEHEKLPVATPAAPPAENNETKPAEGEKPAEGDKPAEGEKTGEEKKPADEPEPTEKKPEQPKPAEKEPEAEANKALQGAGTTNAATIRLASLLQEPEKPATETPKEEAPKAGDSKADPATPETKKPADNPAEPPAASDAKPDDPKADETKKPDEAKPDEFKKPGKVNKPDAEAIAKALEAEGKRVEQENKSKDEDYKKKLETGKKRAEDLNARFASWYYVIADDVYQKLHVTRDQVVKKKEKPVDPNAKELPEFPAKLPGVNP